MTHVGLSSFDVVKSHWVARLPTRHYVSPGPCLVDVVDFHGVSEELGRRGWPDFNLWQVVIWVQRIVSLSFRLELDNLRCSSTNVICLKVRLFLVEADVEGARARSVDVPVLVHELGLVHLLRAVQFWGSTCNGTV